MKLQLDTTNKTIKVEESVGLRELTDALEKLLPDGEWKEFKLETNTVIKNWSAPIIIRERTWPYWNSPWYGTPIGFPSTGSPTITYDAGALPLTQSRTLKAGTYNIEA